LLQPNDDNNNKDDAITSQILLPSVWIRRSVTTLISKAGVGRFQEFATNRFAGRFGIETTITILDTWNSILHRPVLSSICIYQ
jgi:hypothetical protein